MPSVLQPRVPFCLSLRGPIWQTLLEAKAASHLRVCTLLHTLIFCTSEYFKAEFQCHLFHEALPASPKRSEILFLSFSYVPVPTIYLCMDFPH